MPGGIAIEPHHFDSSHLRRHMLAVRVLSGLVFGAMAGIVLGVVSPFLLAFLVSVFDKQAAAAVPWFFLVTVPVGCVAGAILGVSHEVSKHQRESSIDSTHVQQSDVEEENDER
jgi:hypothetical protein